jgi:hypothetical protein
MYSYVGDPWAKILRLVHVYHFHKPADEFSTRPKDVIAVVKPIFVQGSYNHISGFPQFVMETAKDPDFSRQIAAALRETAESRYARRPVMTGTAPLRR